MMKPEVLGGRLRHVGARSLLASADVVVWEAEPWPLRLLRVEGDGVAALGHDPASWTARDGISSDVMPADDRARLAALCREVAADGRPRGLEHRLLRKDGTLARYGTSVRPGCRDGSTLVIGTTFDIGAIACSPAGMSEHEERLRLVLDHLPVIVWSALPDGRITSSDGSGLIPLGLEPGELVGTSVFDFVRDDPDARDQFLRALAGETLTGTRRTKSRWHEYRVTPSRRPDGTISGVIGVVLDTTETREAGLAWKESEGRLRAILAHAPMILWAVDRKGRVTLSEGKGLAALGLAPGEGVGTNAFAYDEQGTSKAWLGEAIAGKPYVGETRITSPPTSWDTRSEPLFDEHGEPAGAIIVSIDITAKKRIEQERDRLYRAAKRALLGERAARRRAMFLAQASRVLAGSLDHDTTLSSIAHLVVPEIADGCVVDIADGTHQTVVAYRDPSREAELAEIARGLSFAANTPAGRAIARGEPFLEPNLDAASVARSFGPAARADLLEALGARSIVVVGMRARGRSLGTLSLLTVSESARRLTADDAELASDLAVHAALAIENARLYGEQTLAVRQRDDFLSVASHELRTPVTSVRLALQAICRQRDRAPMPAITSSLLDTAARQSKRLAQLVEDLLDVSRIASGQLSIHLDRVDLVEVVRDVAASLSGDLAEASCPLEVSGDASVVGIWDRARLEQVVVNMLSNAIKYGRGKPVGISVEQSGSEARLSVRDRGIGIPPEAQSAIFDRFERAVSARQYGGFGLGLYIVKQIVAALGGSIAVESEPGAGATFIVTLPLAGPAQPAEPRAST